MKTRNKNQISTIFNVIVADRRNKGFTFVEIMVAIAVLGISLFVAASMLLSAVDNNSSANQISEAIGLAQARIEQLTALEYSHSFTDPELINDAETAQGSEPYSDSNGNGHWDLDEQYTDSNANGLWDAAHVDPHPPAGYTVCWSVKGDSPVLNAKHIRVYVTHHDGKKTVTVACIRSRE